MEKESLFEVWRDGKPIMSTNQESCIYDNKTIRSMKAAGYTIIDRRKKQKRAPENDCITKG